MVVRSCPMFAIVMAGGVGTRLWPLSRRRSPKQLLALTGETSLLQQTVARLGRPAQAARHLRHHLAGPRARHPGAARSCRGTTCSASRWPARPLSRRPRDGDRRRESDEVALVLPADHFLADEGAFAEAMRQASAAERGTW